MVLNQLFITKPNEDIINKLVHNLGLDDLNDNREFTVIDMEKCNIVDNFNNMKKDLSFYYLPCKNKIYLDKLTYKKCITISRQFLKTINYDITTREKFINSKKYLLYKLTTKQNKLNKLKEKEQKKKLNNQIVITFD